MHPVWPLPHGNLEISPEEIRTRFAKYGAWHYSYQLEGGLQFPVRGSDPPPPGGGHRPLQRFRHFMPYLLQALGGSLRGKRVLDIACNSGFWSIQCALLGADVVGFDARAELIEQANLIKSIVWSEERRFPASRFLGNVTRVTGREVRCGSEPWHTLPLARSPRSIKADCGDDTVTHSAGHRSLPLKRRGDSPLLGRTEFYSECQPHRNRCPAKQARYRPVNEGNRRH